MPRSLVTVPTLAMATMYAAVRMSTLYYNDVCSTSSNASHIFFSCREFTSASAHN